MTYVYETKMGGKHLVVEYCFHQYQIQSNS